MKRIACEQIAAGKWLLLNELTYEDRRGKIRTWEAAARQNCAGAVAMICTLKPSNRLVLVRQYRPPVNKFTIEFPAGLVNHGESPEETAIRELREETGYRGKVLRVLPPAYSSPGLTSEATSIVIMEADEAEQGTLQTQFDESEDIETLLVGKHMLEAFLLEADKRGEAIDGKLLSYAEAMRTD